jgi:hypothetical protein
MIEENKPNNFFKMMLTETSPKPEDEVGLLEKEKEQLAEDLDNKKISQDVYDKKLQEIETKISNLKSSSYKAEAESVKSTNDVSGEKNTDEESIKERVTEVSPKETEDKTPPPPKVKQLKLNTSEKELSVQEKKDRQAQKNMPEQDKIKVESRSEQLPYYEQKEDLEEVIMQKIQELKTIQSGNPIKINQEKFDPQEFISDKGEAAIPQSMPAILGQRNVQPLRNEQSTRSLNSIGDSGLILQMQKVLDVSWRTLSY